MAHSRACVRVCVCACVRASITRTVLVATAMDGMGGEGDVGVSAAPARRGEGRCSAVQCAQIGLGCVGLRSVLVCCLVLGDGWAMAERWLYAAPGTGTGAGTALPPSPSKPRHAPPRRSSSLHIVCEHLDVRACVCVCAGHGRERGKQGRGIRRLAWPGLGFHLAMASLSRGPTQSVRELCGCKWNRREWEASDQRSEGEG